MELLSSAFNDMGMIERKFTCEGENINPPLTIKDVPKESKSLVLIMDDPDAPNQTWDHWIVGGISPDTKDIEENMVPGKWQGKNSWGNTEYGGPCPPNGIHRYFFKLYALNIELDMNENPTKSEVENAIKDNIIASSTLIGRYIKSNS